MKRGLHSFSGDGVGSCCWHADICLRLQEVNEGVQALSNSEEEKKGVAAALLAPLLPEQVKEEEERWRRKVICKEEVEPSPEEEVKGEEATATAPEEPEPSKDPLEDTVQEELCSVVQSGESAEEEEEQDTLELEMVLERKKVSGMFLSKEDWGATKELSGEQCFSSLSYLLWDGNAVMDYL